MIPKLDSSHGCLLENWETITQMRESASQVERYLVEMARKVLRRLRDSRPFEFEAEDHLGEENAHLQLLPRRTRGWKGSDQDLIAIGIEHVAVSEILDLNSENPCSAFVYSTYIADCKNTDGNKQLDRIVKLASPLAGFALATSDRGYIYTKQLPRLTPQQILDARQVTEHFMQPMEVLINWWQASEKRIVS